MSYYLYSDASIKAINNPARFAYIGGMITDEQGKIMFSYFDKIESSRGFTNAAIDYAEAVALKIGLEHAHSMNIKDIQCMTDSRNCVALIQNEMFNVGKDKDKVTNFFTNRVPEHIKNIHKQKIKDIVTIFDEFFNSFEIKHIFRKHNAYADNMSKYLQVFEKGSNKEVKQFKKILKNNMMDACAYDFIEERKNHINEENIIRQENKLKSHSLRT